MKNKRETRFGKLLRVHRAQSQLSLRELAKLLGVSHAYLSEVEHGVRGPVTRERWPDLLRVLPTLTKQELLIAERLSRPLVLDLASVDAAYIQLVFAVIDAVKKRQLTRAQVAQILEILTHHSSKSRNGK